MPKPLYFSHYRVFADANGEPWRLGSGAMGITYKAFDERLQLSVALKVISPARLNDPAVQSRFLREARAAAKVRHTNVASVLALDDTPGKFFYAMEFVDGVTLEAFHRERRRLPAALALDLAAQVAHGLEAIHRQGIVHRDLKPANLMLVPARSSGADPALQSDSWQVKVIDFGLAHAFLGESGADAADGGLAGFRGTVMYASPEQCLERTDLDGRADLYSLGCILWEMLTGQPPFLAKSHHELLSQHVSRPVPLPQLAAQPPVVRALVVQLLAKSPADRPASASAVAHQLEDAAKNGRPNVSPSAQAATEAAPATLGTGNPKSLAVLPFTVLGGEQDHSYFADGLSEELLNVLASLPAVRVVSRTSAFSFRGSSLAVPEIARRLGVAYVLDGSVRFAGRRVRITAQLASASDGFQIWTEAYEREVHDVFAVQDEIARAVARVLELKLTSRGDAILPDPEAYRLYLEARNAWRQRTPVSLDHAEQCLQRALALDPRFARALVALADVPLARVDLAIIGNEPASAFEPVVLGAMERAREAIRLEPDLAEAHASLGLAHRFLGERSASITCYRRAVTLNPNYAPAYQWLARALTGDGRIEEALEHVTAATVLDPLAPRILDNRALLLLLAGRPTEALVLAQRGLAITPEDVQLQTWRIWAFTLLGRSGEILEEARSILRQPRTGYYHTALRALLAAGRRGEAEGIAAEIPAASVLARCRCAAVLGHNEEALALLDHRFLPYITHDALLYDSMWDPLREAPRFQQMLAELHLGDAHTRAQFWRSAEALDRSTRDFGATTIMVSREGAAPRARGVRSTIHDSLERARRRRLELLAFVLVLGVLALIVLIRVQSRSRATTAAPPLEKPAPETAPAKR